MTHLFDSLAQKSKEEKAFVSTQKLGRNTSFLLKNWAEIILAVSSDMMYLTHENDRVLQRRNQSSQRRILLFQGSCLSAQQTATANLQQGQCTPRSCGGRMSHMELSHSFLSTIWTQSRFATIRDPTPSLLDITSAPTSHTRADGA